MKSRIGYHYLLFLPLLTVAIAAGAASATLEAESGVLGSDWAVSNSVSPAYITITTAGTGGNPASTARVAAYSVTFPVAGAYNLYAHVRVGPDTFNDDSMYYGNGFGAKSATTDNDWITVNGLASPSGFNNSSDVVVSGGTLGSGMWKWINLSQYSDSSSEAPITFTVPAGSLTQTFQIGAREDGLDIDKFVFGTTGYSFTVSNLDNGTDGAPPGPPTTTIDTTKTYQTIEGLGGATAFYAGWITAHPYKQEIYTNAFAGLNLSMLRLGDWYRYQTPLAGFDSAATEIVANANRVLGHSVPVYMSSWSPPAFLKSNGQVGNGGTLIFTNGSFAYTNFAQYWYDSIQAYQSNGVNLTWASIQNEPDFVASYDSCIFHPTEDTVNGTNYASYSKALDAVYQKLSNLPSPPKLLAPEPVHISFGDLGNYGATMNSNSFYGVAHHLYGDGGATGDSFLSAISSATNVFRSKPHFMTEYGDVADMIECANLIHNSLVVEQVSGYNHWSLVWPGTTGGLIQIENPFASQSTWTNAPPGTPTQSHGWWYSPSYWAIKHFSYFIQPGYKRVSATDNDNNVRSSAFLSPDGLRLVVVLINTNAAVSSTMNFDFGATFNHGISRVYQTASTNYYFQSLGILTNAQVLPPRSLTTVVLDTLANIGPASNPSPGYGATSVALNSILSWMPGSNAVTHAVYLGVNSNAVAQAATGSQEFQAMVSVTNYSPLLSGGQTYFWRVDEIAGVNTNTGLVWSFSTLPVPALAHRYSFSETGGTTAADSIAGPSWNGTLPNGGTFYSGQLTLASTSLQYVSLPAGIMSTFSNFTIEAWVKLNTTANWSRIFDFGSGTTTYMFLTPQNGSTSQLRFAITTSGGGGEQQINGTSALVAGTSYHVVVTLNGNTGKLYLNGVVVGTNNAMTLRPSSLGSTVNNYLGKSQYSDPYMNGLMDEFRIYSVALSPAEIAATFALGSNQLLSTNSPAIGFSMSANNPTLSWPLDSAGFTVQSRTNLILGNWVNANLPTPQIVGGQWQVILPVTTSTPSTFYRLLK